MFNGIRAKRHRSKFRVGSRVGQETLEEGQTHGRNVVNFTIKMKTIVRKPLRIKIIIWFKWWFLFDYNFFAHSYIVSCKYRPYENQQKKRCPHGVMVKAMDCGIVVLQSRYYVHFRTNTLGKGMNLLILPAMG